MGLGVVDRKSHWKREGYQRGFLQSLLFILIFARGLIIFTGFLCVYFTQTLSQSCK